MIVPWKKKIRLYNEIRHAIYNSASGLKDPQEPDYIAALVCNFSLNLRSILKSYIPGRFRVGGCFIHQKPLARFCDPSIAKKAPEIGDLLIVYKEIIYPDNEVRYNALLLQAKKTKDIYRTYVSGNDKHQLILYTQWPRFAYDRAGHLNGRIRNIIPKTITSGAQYLLIDEHEFYHCCCPAPSFWCAMPQEHLVASNTLAMQIVKFLEFQVGRPFVDGSTRDHWSQMIWDLLRISAESKFNRQRSGYHYRLRSSGDIFSILLENYNQQEIYNEDGISVLCIEGQVEQQGTVR